MERLEAVGAPIAGAVLNLASASEAGTYRYGYAPLVKATKPRHATRAAAERASRLSPVDGVTSGRSTKVDG